MNRLTRHYLFVLLTLLAANSWAKTESFEDKVCPAIDESGLLHREVLGMLQVEQHNVEVVVGELTVDRKQLVKNAVRYELARIPDDVDEIVAAALIAGATTEDIAIQCDCSIPEDIVPNLVASAILNRAEPETMIRRCLRTVSRGHAYDVLLSALNAANPDALLGILYAAIETFNLMGYDNTEMLIQALADSDKITDFGNEPTGTGTLDEGKTDGEQPGQEESWTGDIEDVFSQLIENTESSGSAEEAIPLTESDLAFVSGSGDSVSTLESTSFSGLGTGSAEGDPYSAAETIVNHLTSEAAVVDTQANVFLPPPVVLPPQVLNPVPEPPFSDS